GPSAKPGRQRRGAADGARPSGAHARLRRDDARRTRTERAGAEGPRHWVYRPPIAWPAARPYVCSVSDTPAKSRGLFGRFLRPAAESAPPPPEPAETAAALQQELVPAAVEPAAAPPPP